MTPEEFAPAVTERHDGAVLCCRVQPGASRTVLVGMYNGMLKIALATPPVDGKANAELCKFLAKKLGLAKSSVVLMSGAAARSKRVLAAGLTKASVIAALCAELSEHGKA